MAALQLGDLQRANLLLARGFNGVVGALAARASAAS